MQHETRENPYSSAMCANKTALQDSPSIQTVRGPARVAQFLNIRTLGPNHRARLMRHLIALEPQDRYLRFGYTASDQQIANYVERLDFVNDAVFGVFNNRLEIVGMAHLATYMDANGSNVGDFGVSVSPSARGKGIGGRLYERAALHARNEGVDVLQIQALAENGAMLAIARKRGATVHRHGPESEAYLKLPRPDLESRLSELLEESWANMQYGAKAQTRIFCGLIAGFQSLRKSATSATKACSP